VTRDAGIEHRTVAEFSTAELLYTGQHLKGNYFKQGCGSGPFMMPTISRDGVRNEPYPDTPKYIRTW